jgi:glycosyltransferase involved in cell wall biosynthesis
VSVVVPTHKRADMLGRCLDALVAQSYDNLEVVVVDDCSPDETPEILERFRVAHPEIKLTLLRNDPQRGANPSRNRGIAAATGEIVAFEDDDCIADPRWIEETVKAFVSDRVGAVTGIVLDPPPKNIYDLAFGGTHLVYGDQHANRVVGCNMAVRRALLQGKLDEDRAQVSSDMTVSGRGDEEGLYLKLKAEGWEVRIAREAKTLHVHHYSRESFYRQAFKGGGSAARVGYKYRLPVRIELLCLLGGWVFLIGTLVNPWSALPSAACFGAFAAGALAYNEIARKGKTVGQALRIAPVMTAYFHLRAYGYFRQWTRLLLGIDELERERLGPAPAGR